MLRMVDVGAALALGLSMLACDDTYVVRRSAVGGANGSLKPEIIQRVVRGDFVRLRGCYDIGLRKNPHLKGLVTTKFVIDLSGVVAMTADGGSDIPDQDVVQCVVCEFGHLSFPRPDGGMVTVVYPIRFNAD